jgi:YgiT-type zinc finger domain-containing protein
MECLHCKGQMKRGTAPFRVDRRRYHVHWDAIPAWVCTQCGEPFFETSEVEEVQRALDASTGPTSPLHPRCERN